LTRGRGWKPPFGTDYAKATEKLQLPNPATGVVKVKVPFWKPVAGPRRVEGDVAGLGWEYYLGWRFPPSP